MAFSQRYSRLSILLAVLCLGIGGCGGHSNTPQPIVLSVNLSISSITVRQGGAAVLVPITVVAPTETVTFTITGLPPGVTQSYKESESNPSGLLTLTASSNATVGTTTPVITVGSSGQTATTSFTLVVAAMPVPLENRP